jgi:23S rRNA pseudouridine1911/1915/1917 synthase
VSQFLQWTVAANETNVRLDAFLTTRLAPLSRRAIRTLIARREILVNGRTSKKGLRLHPGDLVRVPAPPPLYEHAALPIEVIYADPDLVVLNKPAGIPSVALHYDETDTVANFLAACFPETADAGPHPLESGLVHRLDTATSGLLIAARTPTSYAFLRHQFHMHTVEKRYLALVKGNCTITGQKVFGLAPTGPRGQRMQLVTTGEGQEASSIYEIVEMLPQHTLIQVTITTGVRHQIRAHLAGLGHPVVGDTVYGNEEESSRLCLHAHALGFVHPATGQQLRFASPLPQDFLSCLESRRHPRRLHKSGENERGER